MKTINISFLFIIITSAWLHADNKQPSTAWQRARERLDAAQGRTAPDAPQAEQKELPTLKDVATPVESETSFIATMRGYLSRFTGCKTWDNSCESSCPSWDKSMVWNDLEKVPGFDKPITCKSYLGSCYQQLEGCTQEGLDNLLVKAIKGPDASFPHRRCKIIALICQGANPNARSTIYNTALYQAVLHSDYFLVKFLLEHGADPNTRGTVISNNDPILPQICSSAHIAKELLDHGADVNAKKTHSNDSALHWAMFDSRHDKDGELTRVLLEHGAEVNARNRSGITPLLELATYCNKYSDGKYEPEESWLVTKKAKLLLQAGANLHHRVQRGDLKGKTALEDARSQQEHAPCKALADFLEEYEKQPNRIQE